MIIADRQKRNEKVLEVFEEVLKENGVMLTFASKKIGIHITTMSSWRNGYYLLNFKQLDIIEEFCSKYL